MYVFIRSSLRSDKNACCEGLIDRNTEAPPKKGSWYNYQMRYLLLFEEDI